MKLLISPTERGWKITEVAALKESLRMRWQGAVIRDIADGNRPFSLEWEIQQDDDYLYGKLDRSEDMVVFEFSSIEFAATFSVWIFGALTHRESIVLYNDSYSTVLPLSAGTTPRAIADAFV